MKLEGALRVGSAGNAHQRRAVCREADDVAQGHRIRLRLGGRRSGGQQYCGWRWAHRHPY